MTLLIDYARNEVGMPIRGVHNGYHVGWTIDREKADAMTDARPFPKSAQLARGERRYRRKVASPKQWQAIIQAKQGPCRVCEALDGTTRLPLYGGTYHHVVSREDHGDDVKDNIVPLCWPCHD